MQTNWSYQHTLANDVSYRGRGLHSGSNSDVSINPACPGTGLVFRLFDSDGTCIEIPATIENASRSSLQTSLGQGNLRINTVEHLLAALVGCGVTNALINASGEEIPIIDGSARGWVDLIKTAGVVLQGCHAPKLRMIRPVTVHNGDAWCSLMPSVESDPGFCIRYDISYPHPMIGNQSLEIMLGPEIFDNELADARTFGFMEDLVYIRSMGLGQGADLSNTVVFSGEELLNPTGLRWENEPIRHKIVDAVGDLSLLGMGIIGCFHGHQSGHKLNQDLVRAVLHDRDSWCIA